MVGNRCLRGLLGKAEAGLRAALLCPSAPSTEPSTHQSPAQSRAQHVPDPPASSTSASVFGE